MNYIQHLIKTYTGKRQLSLGKSVEDFLNENLDPNTPQVLDFNELDKVMRALVPPTGYEDFICKKLSPNMGLERWSISSGRKPNFMVYGFKPNSSGYAHIRANLPYQLVKGIDTFALLAQMMQKDLTLRVLPHEIRVMS